MRLQLLNDSLLDRVPGSQPVTVYHGTSSTFLPSILKYGLLAGKGELGQCNDLSVTVDQSYTKQWLEDAVRRNGGVPIILKMDLPRGKLMVNKENMRHTSDSRQVPAAFVRGGKVPSQLISVIWANGFEEPIQAAVERLRKMNPDPKGPR